MRCVFSNIFCVIYSNKNAIALCLFFVCVCLSVCVLYVCVVHIHYHYCMRLGDNQNHAAPIATARTITSDTKSIQFKFLYIRI